MSLPSRWCCSLPRPSACRASSTANNLVAIVRSVSVLGILALGMAVVIIGRGIDLSAVAIMAMSVAWYLQLLNRRNAGRAGLRLCAGRRARHRPAQRLSRRLCRRAGDLRDAGDRLLRLRLCALATDHAGCRAGAAGPLGRAARRPALPRHSDRSVRLRRRSPSCSSCSCASPNGAATSISPATIRSPRATSAFRCGRCWCCAMCSRPSSRWSPACSRRRACIRSTPASSIRRCSTTSCWWR